MINSAEMDFNFTLLMVLRKQFFSGFCHKLCYRFSGESNLNKYKVNILGTQLIILKERKLFQHIYSRLSDGYSLTFTRYLPVLMFC